MKYHNLGKTDIRVSEIAMGCWGLVGGSMWGSQSEADSIATVAAALDAGVNFFDTAEAYGDGYSEEVLGKALTGRRDWGTSCPSSRRSARRKGEPPLFGGDLGGMGKC